MDISIHAGRLQLLAGNQLLTSGCLTLLTQTISSLHHPRLSELPLHPLATPELVSTFVSMWFYLDVFTTQVLSLLPCCCSHSPQSKQRLCLLIQGFSDGGARLCLQGSERTIQHADNKQLHNPQMFASAARLNIWWVGRQTIVFIREDLSLIK